MSTDSRLGRLARRMLVALAGAALLLTIVAHLAQGDSEPSPGLVRSVFAGPGAQGPPLVPPELSSSVDLDFVDEDPSLPRRYFSVRWEGYWALRRSGPASFYLGADDRATLEIDGRVILRRDVARPDRPRVATRTLDAGLHRIRVTVEQDRGGYSVNLRWAPAGESPRLLPADALFARAPTPHQLEAHARLRLLRAVAWVAWTATMALGLVVVAAPRSQRSLDVARAWWASARSSSLETRLGYCLPPLIALAYGWLLVRWFHDPGQPNPAGLPERTRQHWPGAVLIIGMAAAWLAIRAPRAARHPTAWRLDRLDRVLLAALLLLALAADLPVLANAEAFLDSDAALHGLMGKHLHDGLIARPFVYGRLLLGTLSSHLMAGAYTVVDPSAWVLLAVGRLWYLVFLAAQYLLLRMSIGRAVAVGASLWLALPGPFLAEQLAYTELAELLAFSGVALLAVAAAIDGRISHRLGYAGAGVALGLGFWSHPQALLVGLTVVTSIWLLRGGRHLWAAGPWLVGAAAMGALPALVGWGWELPAFLAWLLAPPTEALTVAELRARLAAIGREGFPYMFSGAGRTVMGGWGALALSGLVVAPALVALARLGFSGRRIGGWRGEAAPPSPELTTRVLLAVLTLVVLAAFVLSRFGVVVIPPRRLILLYASVPALVAITAAGWIARLRPRLAGAGVILLMAGWVALGLGQRVEWLRRGADRQQQLQRSLRIVRDAGVTHCEAPYWTAYWISFASLEHIVCAQYEHERDPYYRALVDANGRFPNRVYIAPPGDPWLRLKREGFVREGIDHDVLETPLFDVALPRR